MTNAEKLVAEFASAIIEPWVRGREQRQHARVACGMRLLQFGAKVLEADNPKLFAELVERADSVRQASLALLRDVVEKHGLESPEEWECQYMRNLAEVTGFEDYFVVEEEKDEGEPELAEPPAAELEPHSHEGEEPAWEGEIPLEPPVFVDGESDEERAEKLAQQEAYRDAVEACDEEHTT